MNARADDVGDELLGELGKHEAEQRRRGSIEAIQAREHYELMLLLATKARGDVASAIAAGVPRIAPARNGERLIASVQHATVYQLINSFAWANCGLWRAARRVVELERLPDDGISEGIEFEVPL